MKALIRTATVFCMTAIFLNVAHAQDVFHVWDGSEGDNWMTTGNWVNNLVPSGANAFATIREGSPVLPNSTVIYNGDTADPDTVRLGDGGTTKSGHLTVQGGATLNAINNVELTGSSTLNSSGTITAADLRMSHTTSANLGGSYTGVVTMFGSSDLSVSGSVTGNMTINNTATASLSGTLNGNFLNNSTAMQNINSGGIVNGDVRLSNGDQLTLAGTIQNGVFNVNGSGAVIIESTASVMSSSNDSWLYDTADVTWNVGSDGSIGTLYTNRGSGSFDAEWRYTGSASFTVNLDDYDSVTHGTGLTVKLVSDIENEATFATGVVFMRNGLDVSSDFSYDGIDTGSFTGTVAIPEPSSLILLGVGLVALSSFRKKE